jgi:hypothetical protein
VFSPSDVQRQGAAYVLHGGIVWCIAGLVYHAIVVVDPVQEFLHPRQALASSWMMTWFFGVLLGHGIQFGLLLSEQPANSRPWMHICFPLMAAACIGYLHARWANDALFVKGGTTLPLRPLGIRYATAVILALLVTPVIVVRSVRLNERRGLRPPLDRDSRWEK